MSAHATYTYDVLIIGAGGAGLRAAIEAANAGVSVGLICKSLLGKAHTVMAEGGMAAAMANNDDRDSWKVHFADTMRGGQYVNNWRMAEIHAKEAPDRVRELEGWGAVFDRTTDGRINQRNFGGHRYPRLAHVGDRTGLELIRTLQDHAIHTGMTVHMEHTVIELLLDGGRAAGVLAYDRERGRFHVFAAKAIVLATGGVGRAYKITSNSWEGTGDGHALAYRAGAELIDMEFIQFHPTGMVWPPSVQGHSRDRRRARRGRRAEEQRGPPLHVRRHPRQLQAADGGRRGRGLALHAGRQERPPSAGAADARPRGALHQPRGEGGARVPARRRVPRHRVDQGEDRRLRGAHQAQAPEHVPPVQGAGRPRHHEGADGGRPDHALHHGRHPRGRRFSQMSTIPGLFAAGECASGINGANRLGGNSLSDLIVFGKRAGEYAAQFASAERRRPAWTTARVSAGRCRTSLAPFERGDQRREPVQGAGRSAGDDAGARRHRPPRARDEGGARRASQEFKERAARVGVTGHREYHSGWHTALDLRNLLTVSEAIARSAIERKESRGGHFREDYPDKVRRVRDHQHDGEAGRRRRDAGVAHSDSADSRPPEAGHRGAEVVMAHATFKIWRTHPDGDGTFQTFHTEVSDGMVVLDVVHKIQAEQAPDLAVRWNCKAGKCGSCSAEINGKPRLMCMTRLSQVNLQEPVTVEPMRAFPPIKDLVTDVSWNFRVKKGITKFTPRPADAPDGTWRMAQRDVDRVQEFRKCIECFLCQDVCHVLRDHDKHEEFIGPRFFVYAANLEMNPLDTADRIPELKDQHDIGYCNITKCCTKVCPEHIHITDNAIIPLKERVVDRFYDPVSRLLRMVTGK